MGGCGWVGGWMGELMGVGEYVCMLAIFVSLSTYERTMAK